MGPPSHATSHGSGNASDDVRRMIKREQEIMDAARRLRMSARNKTVRSQCDSQISEAARNISYLQEQLDKLHVVKSESNSPTRGNGKASDAGGDSTDLTARSGANGKITRLDLFRWDRPASMGPRIRLMLQQLEYKTSIEQQYERGTQKLIDLYGQTGDRRSQAEAYANLAESRGKMALLKRSKKRYSDMNLAAVLGSSNEDDVSEFDVGFGAPNMRKPLTGMLRVVVQQVEEVDHTIAWADQVEMWVTMKVENNSAATARTRVTRTSQFGEDFTIPVDKGNEIEFTVYDRSVWPQSSGSGSGGGAGSTASGTAALGSGSSTTGAMGSDNSQQSNPVALMWLRISDIAEAIRQKRVEREFKETGWASADQVQARQSRIGTDNGAMGMAQRPVSPQKPPGSGGGKATTRNTGSSGNASASGTGSSGTGSGSAGTSTSGDDVVEGWFTLEPAGRIYLKLGFEKTGVNSRKRARVYDNNGPSDLGRLGRHNAIRKREETQQVHGHEFELHQAYNIVRCAVCGDFTTSYFQCQECKLTCDRKCFSKIVTKCTALMSQDPDEEELNHRIPHQFEPTSNMKASWCAQCGFILPLASKKNVRKCTECGIMVHLACSQYVPDLCGMSMETAAQVVNEINSTRIRQATKAAAGSLNFHHPATPHHSKSTQPVSASSVSTPATHGASRTSPGKSIQAHSKTPSIPPPHSAYGQAKPQHTTVAPPSKPGPVRRKQVPGLIPPDRMAVLPDSAPNSGRKTPPLPTQAPPQLPSSLPIAPPPPGTQAPSSYGPHRGIPDPQYVPGQPYPPGKPGYPQSQTIPGQPGFPLPNVQKSLPQVPSQHATAPAQKTDSIPGVPQSQPIQPTIGVPQIPPTAPPTLPPVSKSSSEQSLHEAARQQATELLAGVTSQDGTGAPPSSVAPGAGSVAALGANSSVGATTRPRRRRKVGLDDFSFLAVLGKGNFGKVMLAESKHSGQLYAVKVLKKNFIIDNREVESTRSEKRVFLIANRERHPFLINLSACFQTENRIYFVMDYVSGGDLMFHIQRKMFSARRAQFYAAEVLLALKHFHDNDVIYRDLKLDNILLSLNGHIKIADYGLCKENMGPGQTTGTFCGTPEFIAPEILLDQKYGRSVDWWALGVLMYQMLLGKSPFHGNDEDEVYDAILSDEPLYPIHMPRDSVSILQQLLTRDPSKRLGSGPKGAREIMDHPYFANINFDDLLALRVEPPYKPEVDSPTDVRFFERDFTSEMPALTPMNSTLTPQMQEEFRGFSYSLGDSI